MNDGSFTLTILVVDDVPDTANSTAELLALYGHVPRVARCGEEALRMVAADMPDVVLLDIGLPDIDGWELARRFRDVPARGKRPILVAVTGYSQDEDHSRSKAAGIDLHLVKPVEPGVLIGMMKRFWRATCPPAGSAATADCGPASGGGNDNFCPDHPG